jgi:drug/metabolite transporter (DMT)-like permease
MEMVNGDFRLRYLGYVMVLAAAALWGLSGTVAQYLFQHEGFQPGWLVTMRMLFSGVILLLLGSIKGPKSIWDVWKERKSSLQIIIFAFVGMLGVQYTYFLAIQLGNAATATFLQYVAPIFIVLYVSLRYRKLPVPNEYIALCFALIGVFLLVTDGSFQQLNVSFSAFLWGIASAVALAFYTIYPENLLKRWGSVVVVGWGMLIGGIALSVINPPWKVEYSLLSISNLLMVCFVILFGTLIAFYLYLDSLKYITPTETGLLASIEPLSATIASVIWLHVPFGWIEFIGGFCIILTVTVLSVQPKKNKLISGTNFNN